MPRDVGTWPGCVGRSGQPQAGCGPWNPADSWSPSLLGLVVKSRGGCFHSVVLCGGAACLTSSILWDGAGEVWGHVVVGLLRPCASYAWGVSHKGSQWSCGHGVRCWAGQGLRGDISSRQGWHVLTLEPKDVVGMIHSDIWGQLAESWVRWAGAGVATLGATSAFFLGTHSSCFQWWGQGLLMGKAK